MAVTEATVKTQLQNAFDVLKEFDNYINSNAENFVSHYDTFIQSAQGDYSPDAISALRGIRSQLNGVVGLGRGLVTPVLFEYAKVLNLPVSGGVEDVIDRISDDYVSNSKTVNSRNLTFGSPSSGSPSVGSGSLFRVTVDADGFDLEAVHAEKKTFTCVRDEHSGATEHEEQFEVTGQTELIDSLTVSGSGIVESISSLSARQSLLQNPSFSSDAATATPTSITGWTVSGSVSNFQILSGSANIYRDSSGDTTPRSLQFDANGSIEQNLNVQRIQADPDVPYLLRVAWNREIASASGSSMTLKIELGSQSKTITVSGTETGWQLLSLPFDKNLYFKNWNKEDPLVKITVAGMDTGGLVIDDIIFAPMTEIDHSFYAIIGGATPFLRDDVFTVTDTDPKTAVINYWLPRLYPGQYLPSDNTGSETLTDP